MFELGSKHVDGGDDVETLEKGTQEAGRQMPRPSLGTRRGEYVPRTVQAH